MFRHIGKTRTFSHNLKIASLLSFVAGIVNVAGFLSVNRLTTNVTGHFAYLMDEVINLRFIEAIVFLLYILFFLLGSFVSNYMVESIWRRNERKVFVYPILIESLILITLAIFGDRLVNEHPNFIACGLLFAMGLQNSLVTQISGAIVRTTHLTGLFTDLGIELSQLFFYKTPEQKTKLLSSIKLRSRIISFFFIGGVIAGLCFTKIGLWVLLIGAITLLAGLTWDYIRFRIIVLKRKIQSR